jgi:hypothetical protein
MELFLGSLGDLRFRCSGGSDRLVNIKSGYGTLLASRVRS